MDCQPAKELEVRQHLPGVPRLDHLEVLGPFQGRGIGTALIRAGEDTARQLGHEQIALGVGLDNRDARRLYERLGYENAGLVPERVQGPIIVRGKPLDVNETMIYLVKRLAVDSGRSRSS